MQVAQWDHLLDCNGYFRKELTAECTGELSEGGQIHPSEASQVHTVEGGQEEHTAQEPQTMRELAGSLKKGCASGFPWEDSDNSYQGVDCRETPDEELIGRAKPQQVPGRGLVNLNIPILQTLLRAHELVVQKGL